MNKISFLHNTNDAMKALGYSLELLLALGAEEHTPIIELRDCAWMIRNTMTILSLARNKAHLAE